MLRVTAILLAIAGAGAGTATPAPGAIPRAQITLLSETDQPRPGLSFLLGIRFTPAAGWHTYWSNPGDSGIPPTVRWKSPDTLHFGPLLHPAPSLLRVAGMRSFVHAGQHILLVRVRADSRIRAGTTLPMVASLTWATCSASLCVPQRATLSLNLKAGSGAINHSASELKMAEHRLPSHVQPGIFRIRGHIVRMQLPNGLRVDPKRATFFPASNDFIGTTPTQVRAVQGQAEIVARVSHAVPSRIDGVLADGEHSYTLSFLPPGTLRETR
jgi:DsbC/DsbD-like thiol-disulfide interchange protein